MYDVIVIGSGPGGYVAAIRAAQNGLKTAIIEAKDFGGTCLNRGCIPTKTILHISHVYRELIHSTDMGINFENPSFDINKAHDKKNEIVKKLQDGICGLLKSNNIDMHKGFGKITSNDTVTVTNAEDIKELKTKNIIIAIGAKPFIPPISGVELPKVLTSDNLLEGKQNNIENLCIVGGGVIGVEMASIYNNLGTNVTIIEAMDRILSGLDKEISQSLAMSFKKRGIKIHTGATLKEIKQLDDKLEVIFEDKKSTQNEIFNNVLISTGRRADIGNLFSENIQVEYDRGIVVNEKFETNIKNIYAIGDCISGSIQLAHVSSAQATNVINFIIDKKEMVDLNLIPACIYVNPEIATVGITEEEAKKQSIKIKVSKYITSGHGKSMLEGLERGFIKLIFEEDTEILLGASLFCGRATDIIGGLTTIIGEKLTAEKIASYIQPHPSFVEGIAEAAENLFGKAVHIAPTKRR
ncbi:MAG: dihydrolipoyl dehydrogenase [Defluviitaleaceae bacterium]|nr:dihydrolipoyl dehydrogenase [Defluviitaleaceae bacterium]